MTTMRSMFAWCGSYEGRGIGRWDTSSVTKMNGIFYGCSTFNQGISAWDTSSVSDMRAMFCDAIRFEQDLRQWDVSSLLPTFDGITPGWYNMFLRAGAFRVDRIPLALPDACHVANGGEFSEFSKLGFRRGS